MRPLHLMDLDAGTQCLLACAPLLRAHLATRLVQQARTADSYRKRLGKVHPHFGAGTLRSATQGYPRCHTHDYCDASYLKCLHILLDALLAAPDHQES